MCTRTMHEEEKLSLFAYKQDFFCKAAVADASYIHAFLLHVLSDSFYVSFICDNCLLLASPLFRFSSAAHIR